MADRMNVIYILDRDENIKATLQAGEPGVDESPLACPYYDAVFTDGIDGEERLEFTVPMKMPDGSPIKDAAEIVENGYCIIQDINNAYRMFEIVEIEDTDTKGYIKQVVAISAAAKELDDDPRIEAEPRPTTASSAMEIALAQSRWKVGIVELTHTGHVHFYRESPLSCLKKIVEEWGGELRFRVRIADNRVVERYVDLLARHGGNFGKRFEYSKDLKEVVRETLSEGVKTAMYGWGKGEPTKDGGYGRRLTFADVEWSKAKGDPVDKPKGQTWVGDPEALARVGRAGFTRHRFGEVTFEDIEDPAELLQKTWEYLQTVNVPKVQYRVKAVDLYRLLGPDRAGHELVQKGDDVAILDLEFNPELLVKARVLTVRWDLKNPENTEYVIGNYITYSTDFQEWVGRELRERVVRVNDPVTWTLTEFKQEASEKWANRPGYFHLSQERGVLVTDNAVLEQSTAAVGLRAGMLALADSWDANANDFNWNTFIDGTSVNADFINTGTLNANLVEIVSVDVETGTSRKVEMYDGNIYTYYQDNLTMAMNAYALDYYDHGLFSDGSNKGNLTGRVALAWGRRREDPENESNARGIAVTTMHDLLALGKTTPENKDSLSELAFYWNKGLNIGYLTGPGSDGDYTKFWHLILTADDYFDSFTDGPMMELGLGNVGDGVHNSGVAFVIGDKDHSGEGSFFNIWEHRDSSGSLYMAMTLQPAGLFVYRDYLYFLEAGTSNIKGWIYTSSDGIFLSVDSDNYVAVDAGLRLFEVVINGFSVFSVDEDGSKTGGVIELSDGRWGMSPVDSPQVLIEDILWDIPITEEKMFVPIDKRYSEAVNGEYAVFHTRGDVTVIEKTPEGFWVEGPVGATVDFRIVGKRRDRKEVYWVDMSKPSSRGGEPNLTGKKKRAETISVLSKPKPNPKMEIKKGVAPIEQPKLQTRRDRNKRS